MNNISSSQFKPNQPKSQRPKDEYGSGKKGLILCSNCKAVYYKKRWHADLESLNKAEVTNLSKSDAPIHSMLCPACQMIANHQYEGRVQIKNIPAVVEGELLGLINNFCVSAYERDPMHRLIAIKKTGSDFEVTVTENQMANRLVHKIGEVFKKVKSGVHFAPSPSQVAHIVIDFVGTGMPE